MEVSDGFLDVAYFIWVVEGEEDNVFDTVAVADSESESRFFHHKAESFVEAEETTKSQRFAGDDLRVEEETFEDEQLGGENEIGCDFFDLQDEAFVELSKVVYVEL
jgi:hypothetical protein